MLGAMSIVGVVSGGISTRRSRLLTFGRVCSVVQVCAI